MTIPTENHSTLKLMNGYPDAGQRSNWEQETEESGSNSSRVRYNNFRANSSVLSLEIYGLNITADRAL